MLEEEIAAKLLPPLLLLLPIRDESVREIITPPLPLLLPFPGATRDDPKLELPMSPLLLLLAGTELRKMAS